MFKLRIVDLEGNALSLHYHGSREGAEKYGQNILLILDGAANMESQVMLQDEQGTPLKVID